VYYRLLTENEFDSILGWKPRSLGSAALGFLGFGLAYLYSNNWEWSRSVLLNSAAGALAIYGLNVLVVCVQYSFRVRQHRGRLNKAKNRSGKWGPTDRQAIEDRVIESIQSIGESLDDRVQNNSLGELAERLAFAKTAITNPVVPPSNGAHLRAMREASWFVATSSMSPSSWADLGLACWLVVQGLVNTLSLARQSHGRMKMSTDRQDFKKLQEETLSLCTGLDEHMSTTVSSDFWSVRFILVDKEWYKSYKTFLQTLAQIHVLFRLPCAVITRENVAKHLTPNEKTDIEHLQQLTAQTTFPPDIGLMRHSNGQLECWWLDEFGEAVHPRNDIIVTYAKQMFVALGRIANEHSEPLDDLRLWLTKEGPENVAPEWCLNPDCWPGLGKH